MLQRVHHVCLQEEDFDEAKIRALGVTMMVVPTLLHMPEQARQRDGHVTVDLVDPCDSL